jgi:hypothetical protein
MISRGLPLNDSGRAAADRSAVSRRPRASAGPAGIILGRWGGGDTHLLARVTSLLAQDLSGGPIDRPRRYTPRRNYCSKRKPRKMRFGSLPTGAGRLTTAMKQDVGKSTLPHSLHLPGNARSRMLAGYKATGARTAGSCSTSRSKANWSRCLSIPAQRSKPECPRNSFQRAFRSIQLGTSSRRPATANASCYWSPSNPIPSRSPSS